MPDTPGPLTATEWLALVRALHTADATARLALIRLLRHHGIDADTLAEAAGPITSASASASPSASASASARPSTPPPQGAAAEPALIPAGDAAPGPDADPETMLAELGADDLDFGAVAGAYTGTRWELVGPLVDLMQAAGHTGLNDNAIRLTVEGNDPEGTIVHPSPFCPDPEQFLSVLAVLARTSPHVRLYRVHRQPDGPAAVLVRVFPDPGPETLAVLDTFHPGTAARVRDMARQVGDALAYLETCSDP